MRHGRHILDCGDIQTGCLKAADCRFATGTRSLDPNFHFLEAVRLRIAGSTRLTDSRATPDQQRGNMVGRAGQATPMPWGAYNRRW